jgi:helicase MOV-10
MPNIEFHVIVEFRPQPVHVGRYSARLELLFEDAHGGHFVIIRRLAATVGDEAEHEQLRPSAPYCAPAMRRQGYRSIRPEDIVWGERVVKQHPYSIKIAPYPVPGDLAAALAHGSQDVGEVIRRLPAAYRPAALSKVNYTRLLSLQLWIEEQKAKYVY